MTRFVLLLLGLIALSVTPISCQKYEVKFGSKKFTESVILGELLTGLAQGEDVTALHYKELGGTRLVFNALTAGEIDAYVEYTGTIQQEILADKELASPNATQLALAEQGVSISQSIGFENRYAFGMLKHRAKALGIETISDLSRHPDLKLGLTNEFVDRQDGWFPLKKHYSLPHENVTGLDHDIAYRQLVSGAIDVIDVYSTDAKIRKNDLLVLGDDRKFFPAYDAVILYRADLKQRAPKVVDALLRLEGSIDEELITDMSYRVEVDGVTDARVANEALMDVLKTRIDVNVKQDSLGQSIWNRTVEHLDLVRRSLIPAILFGIPLGILAYRWRLMGQVILAGVGIIQTIPALALLVLVMPLVTAVGGQSLGVGSISAVLALFLYSLLPIVRNTFTGLSSIENQYTESAHAIGLSSFYRLRKIELPLASRSILSGIKTAAVINVGFATLGALIGAGGYGQPILTGIRLASTDLILQGAIPAAAMAISIQVLFEIAESWAVPEGLRLKTEL